MGASPTSSGSSSEEADANWRAAIESIAATTTFGSKNFGTTSNGSTSHSTSNRDNEEQTQNSQKLKHYQLKAQKLLDDILGKTLEMVSEPADVPGNPIVEDGGVRLFKHSPAGIVFDHIDEIQRPTKRPRLLPGYDIDEKLKEFRLRTRFVAVDGLDIIASAREASQKALARMEAKEAAVKAKAKEEEERVAELKRIRGERWLPSIAKEMQFNRNTRQQV
ncbi:uncharacterized protein LOC8283367 isoform X1 [Ricinus communis]|uniref:uncharacterized protein LOC8283367 isoform X1 n=1 Tax=Ricinus communis TaxID=3988 RepID=UPI000772B51C|nr:uncharacterized protein LOC8283367 isoform X1 [Ricinus communis]|eukprot:XP_002525274.2 uncharacterized protein LOC8283367 isoform X1 [Ricinus communis]